ncbi:MAG: lysine--tRNA ligase [Clostridia bacterium]|nr:lysine--tRNA ligase [Clostridia bacterium]
MAENTQNVKNTAPLSEEEEAVALAEQARIRREKLSKLSEEGKNPFVKVKYETTAHSEKIKNNFDSLEGKEVSVAGRLMSRRVMGKASFAHLQDESGLLQIYVRRDDVGEEEYASFKKDYDLGDIVGVKGYVFKTQTGETSVHCTKIEMLSKCLLPLPEKQHGLKDTDIRYRRRELDLIVNPEVKSTFVKRSQIINRIRGFLDGKGFLEVDTPVLNTLEIGAAARPFKTKHNALDIDMYLRIETELYLKRLIVGGLNRVYEVGRIFRNEGMDAFHNPEFTTVECYAAYLDYFDMMNLVEEMYAWIAKEVCGTTDITYQGTEIHLGGKWTRMTMKEAVKKFSGADYDAWATDEDARACAKKLGVAVEEGDKATKGHVLIALFDAFVEDKLVQPTFIYDYPVENSPLAKRKEDDPAFTQRFEYFICAHEFGNAFSELNDPIDQKQRFVRQVEEKRAQEPNCNAQIDEDFVTALEYGLPPTGGLGFGVDRLVMLLTDSATIRDVLLFPTMKPKK